MDIELVRSKFLAQWELPELTSLRELLTRIDLAKSAEQDALTQARQGQGNIAEFHDSLCELRQNCSPL